MTLPERSKTIIPFASLVLIISIAASIRAQKPITVIGSVADQNSAPIAGAHVTLYSLDRILQTTSDSSGRYQFDAVPAGTYEFEVLAQGFKRTARSNLYIIEPGRTPAQDKSGLDVVLEVGPTGSARDIMPLTKVAVAPTGACGPPDSVRYDRRVAGAVDGLRGVVVNGYPKMPLAGATLQLFDPTGAQIAQQQTNERGEFQFKQTAPGRYQMSFQLAGYWNQKFGDVRVARENTTFLTLRAVPSDKIVVCQ